MPFPSINVFKTGSVSSAKLVISVATRPGQMGKVTVGAPCEWRQMTTRYTSLTKILMFIAQLDGEPVEGSFANAVRHLVSRDLGAQLDAPHLTADRHELRGGGRCLEQRVCCLEQGEWADNVYGEVVLHVLKWRSEAALVAKGGGCVGDDHIETASDTLDLLHSSLVVFQVGRHDLEDVYLVGRRGSQLIEGRGIFQVTSACKHDGVVQGGDGLDDGEA
jgi:hypothetical protein